MAAGYPLKVNGIGIRTSEALYQACRYPLRIDVQKNIIEQKSPMAAKMVMKPYKEFGRADWQDVKIDIMYWCLKIKLAQNYEKFGELLDSTDDRPIVEDSWKDSFWGAIPNGENLVGYNVLGQLLMQLRDEDQSSLGRIEPVDVKDFLLFGEQIEAA